MLNGNIYHKCLGLKHSILTSEIYKLDHDHKAEIVYDLLKETINIGIIDMDNEIILSNKAVQGVVINS